MKTFHEWAEHYGYQDTTVARADYERYKSELAILLKPSAALTPCQCQRCGWLGKLHDAHELQTDPVQYICPRCTTEAVVQKLGQKGLCSLRSEYQALVTRKAWNTAERTERMGHLERFFAHIDQPL